MRRRSPGRRWRGSTAHRKAQMICGDGAWAVEVKSRAFTPSRELPGPVPDRPAGGIMRCTAGLLALGLVEAQHQPVVLGPVSALLGVAPAVIAAGLLHLDLLVLTAGVPRPAVHRAVGLVGHVAHS